MTDFGWLPKKGAKAANKARPASSDSREKVEAYVKRQSPALQMTINRLRATVKAAVPELAEQMRWAQVGYLISKKDVCGIYAVSDHVNLSFMHGATLRDPKRLLEGTGKGIRHIKIARMEDVDEGAVKEYVTEAVAAVLESS
jgi:hypothetical protein